MLNAPTRAGMLAARGAGDGSHPLLMPRFPALTDYLSRAPRAAFVAYAIVASFGTYFCMYAFRKPFAAARFDGLSLWGTAVDLKTSLVIGQILGYTASKYLGIKWVSEAAPETRARLLLLLIGLAELSLVAFALVPNDWKVVAIFANGLPLGMVWGMVVRYLEGRRTSEVMLAGLSSSFIVASGVVKDVGRWLLATGISDAWMPAAAGGLFVLPFCVFVVLLDQVPAPTAEDVAARGARSTMTGPERRAFLARFLGGLALLLLVYFFITAYRDFRDNYGVEIFASLGYAGEPTIFTETEVPVALGVLLVLAALNLVKDNRRGLVGAFLIMIGGAGLIGAGTVLLDAGTIDGATWMVLTGLGSYLVYVPYGSVLFDRLVASTGVTATAVFTIYVADAVGYTGSIGVQLFKDLAAGDATRLMFFRRLSYVTSVGAVVLLAASCLYFAWRTRSVAAEREPTA